MPRRVVDCHFIIVSMLCFDIGRRLAALFFTQFLMP